MRLGYHAPPVRSASGVAHYAQRLAAALEAHCEIARDSEHADVHLYHLGNNQLHREIYGRALMRPGVVLLHDANLHHFYLGSLARPAYLDEFTWQYGEWNRGLGEQLWDNRARSAADPAYFRYAMLKRVTGAARTVIVHNRAAAGKVLEQAPEARVEVIPHLVEERENPGERAVDRVRAELGVGRRDFLLGVFGYLRETKRLAQTLRAFRAARSAEPRLRLLVAGEFVSQAYRASIATLLDTPGVIYRPRLEDAAFWAHICAVDACVNLRYPASGESSGIGAFAMAAGKALIVTAGGESDELPEDCCLAVEAGPNESFSLTVYFQLLASHPELARQMGVRLRGHALGSRGPRQVARLFLNAIENTNFT